MGASLDRNTPILYKGGSGECMLRIRDRFRIVIIYLLLQILLVSNARGDIASGKADELLKELQSPEATNLEELVQRGSPLKSREGFASYYAKRFEGRRTTSGQRYHPEKMTGAHHSLPLGTVVRVVNPTTNQEVHVTINDRCARKPFPFIDLSRAAAKKIGLWGKGKIKVVIIPLLQETLEEPA
jgi:rare lipoprotein A